MDLDFADMTYKQRQTWIEMTFWKGLLEGTSGVRSAAWIILNAVSQEAYERGKAEGRKETGT